ncbi:MAG: Carbon-nitrogen hydrolase [Paenibacillaceae bacterium]|nr:Carbon-nitrogen hydrolase [Paenibacillaceae bacterium]
MEELDQQIRIDALVKAFFCRDCLTVDIINGRVECREPHCTCSEVLPMKRLIDLYAALFFVLDSVNYDVYYLESKKKRIDDLAISEKSRIAGLWNIHIQCHPYSGFGSIELEPGTVQMVTDDLNASRDPMVLLVRTVAWLSTLDEHLELFHRECLAVNKYDLACSRGRLIAGTGSILRDCVALKLKQAAIPKPVDANYSSMRYAVRHFFLIRPSTFHPVQLRTLRMGDGWGVEEAGALAVGFIPGKLTAEDYDWKVDTSSKPYMFTFAGIRKKRFERHTLRAFRAIIRRKPHIVVLPELYTPVPLQNELMRQMRESAVKEQIEGNSVRFLLTGTFHQERSNNVYNYGRAAQCGFPLYDIYKMKPFIIPSAGACYEGSMKIFEQAEGIEGNSVDKNMIHMLNTAIGRIAVFVCIDFITDAIDKILIDYQVDLVIVMAYTNNPAGGKFQMEARRLGERVRATVMICNNTGSRDKHERAVVFFPGVKRPYISDKYMTVSTIAEMLDLAIVHSVSK